MSYRERWQYMTARLRDESEASLLLTGYGADGWELVAVTLDKYDIRTAYLKRAWERE